MTNKQTIELTTYEEVPQFLKLEKDKLTLPNDKVWYFLAGLGVDYILFVVLEIPTFLPIFTVVSIIIKCYIDEILKWQLINMKSIREITEIKHPHEVGTYTVNTGIESRVISRISDDKQLPNGFILRGEDYDTIAAYYASNDDIGFRRDDSVSGKGVKVLCDGITSSNFGKLKEGLSQAGYIDSYNNFTESGLEFLGVNYE